MKESVSAPLFSPSDLEWQKLGQNLAKLHTLSFPFFGWERDHSCADFQMKNSFVLNWGHFFFHNRLLPAAREIKDRPLRNCLQGHFYVHQGKVIEYLNAHAPRPALIHGHLWRGNIIFRNHEATWTKPVHYFADPEVDLAMSELFGGFPPSFYEGYGPRPYRDESRQHIYNLYPSLAFFNRYGDRYWHGIEQALATIDSL